MIFPYFEKMVGGFARGKEASKTPCFPKPNEATISPCGLIIALIPLFVERTRGNPSSTARIWVMLKC